MEEFAVESHLRAIKARDEGRFETQIAPLNGVQHDEGPREPNWEKIRSLQTLTPDGKLTAACASQISDASAALLIANDKAVKAHGLKPRARIHHISVLANDPIMMLSAPIPATRRALEKTGLSIDDIDLVEINEAFAPVVMAWMKELGADHSKVNVNGGAIALGHPLGATGARTHDDAVVRVGTHRWSLRIADHVRRWRSSKRDHHRTTLTITRSASAQ